MKNENIYFIILVCLLDNLKLFDFGLRQSENNDLLNSIIPQIPKKPEKIQKAKKCRAIF